jgi:hypothetical protein
MGRFKNFSTADKTSTISNLNQLIDVIQEDVSGSSTRRAYRVFVTGGIGPGVTSSLFQTVYDQDFSLQTSNPIMDLSVGLFESSMTVTGTVGYSKDATTDKLLFGSSSLMMREKVDTYRQMASFLLGDATKAFYLGATAYPFNAGTTTTVDNRIDNAFFVNFKRLFARDKIRKETFAMRFYQSASISGGDGSAISGHDGSRALQSGRVSAGYAANLTNRTGSNCGVGAVCSEEGVQIFADIGANSDSRMVTGGEVSRIKFASDVSRDVGLMFYDAGCAVFDLSKLCWADQHMSGTIDAMTNTKVIDAQAGQEIIGRGASNGQYADAIFIPDYLRQASIDNIIDHLASTRFSSGTLTGMAFQNQTQIQSTVYFCRAQPGDFNFSTNPTFLNSDNTLAVIEDVTDPTERSFTFITTVGLYNSANELLAVGKLSRPIEKNDEKDLTIRVRLDF